MIYLKLTALSLWMVLCCFFGFALCFVRWGDINNDWVFGQLFIWGAQRITGVGAVVQGREHLESRQPCIYVANHQSSMDMVTFGTIYPRRTVVVGKKEVLYIPFFGLFFKAAGNIVINRKKRVSAIAGLSTAVTSMKEKGVSIFIFPEGTRNRTDEPLMPFKKGAFYMAIQAGVPIVPIVSSPLNEIFDWKRKLLKPGSVRLTVLPPVETTGYTEKEVDRLCDDVHALMLRALQVVT